MASHDPRMFDVTPLVFAPSFETVPSDEADTIAALSETLRGISETTFADYGHAVRSVHAKSHALLHAELEIAADLPEPLAQGLFARPGRHPAAMRISTNPGDVLDDSVSAPRGLGLKILDVEGERLEGSPDASTQDFVMANAPAFSAADPKAFLSSLRLLAKTTDTPQVFKKALSAVLRGTESALEAVGSRSATLLSLGGQPLTHVLGETFYSQVPVLYGAHVAKLSVAPASQDLKALTGQKVSVAGRPDALREEALAFMAGHEAVWELRVQLCTDLGRMPIEDASVVWPEEQSPYITVGRITARPQPSWDQERSRAMDDGLSFSPWHGLAAHRPLGGIMRARRPTYEMSAQFRASHNGSPIHEPRVLAPQDS